MRLVQALLQALAPNGQPAEGLLHVLLHQEDLGEVIGLSCGHGQVLGTPPVARGCSEGRHLLL